MNDLEHVPTTQETSSYELFTNPIIITDTSFQKSYFNGFWGFFLTGFTVSNRNTAVKHEENADIHSETAIGEI